MENKKVKNIKKGIAIGTVAAIMGTTGFGMINKDGKMDKTSLEALNKGKTTTEQSEITDEAIYEELSDLSYITGISYGQHDSYYNNEYNLNNKEIHEEYGDIMELTAYEEGYREGYEGITELKNNKASINEKDINNAIESVKQAWHSIDKEYVKNIVESFNQKPKTK